MNTARLLVPIFTLQDFLYLLLDFLLAGFRICPSSGSNLCNRCTREHFRLRVPVTFNYYCLYVIRKRLLPELMKTLSVSSSSVLFISFVLATL